MLLMPSSLQNSNLPAAVKRGILTIQHRLPDDFLGIDGINLSGIAGDDYFGVIFPKGLVLLSFKDPMFLSNSVSIQFLKQLHLQAVERFTTRLRSHFVLKNSEGNLLFPVSIVYVFPDTATNDLPGETLNNDFISEHCCFKDWFISLQSPLKTSDLLADALSSSFSSCITSIDPINEGLRDVIINRIAPWATIPKITQAEIDRSIKKVASLNSLNNIDLPHNDSLVDVLRLDNRQVDEVNAIKKGHQLILACAGSGKSVILIAKCFKLASMDQNRRFILLCYNKNLRDFYRWQIDEAGFVNRNVECLTVHQLFNKLCEEYHIQRPNGYNNANCDDAYFNTIVDRVLSAIKIGTIPPLYYGIFIDEVQIFMPSWYRACYMLLENPLSDEHIFAICGDLTQNLRKSVKRGEAPWQGDGLPVFRGHTIHIETNYRNSVQINDFVNIYAGLVKSRMPKNDPLPMDTYLRGKAFRMGFSPVVSYFNTKDPNKEAEQIIKAVRYMHDERNIGYSEIAILIYNRCGTRSLNYKYPLLAQIKHQFYTNAKDIPFVELSWDSHERKPYALRDGVSIITYEGVLGIDFRGVIVGGISLIGTYFKVQNETPETIAEKTTAITDYRIGFDALYLAFTRAKDCLALILPIKASPICTVYCDIVHECIARYQEEKGEVITL